MKILFYIDGLGPGGKEHRLLELMKYIKEHGDADMELALMSHDIRYPEIHELGIKFHYIIRRSKKDPRVYFMLYKLCKSIKPDIIHVWDSMTAVYAAPIAWLLKLKLVNGMIVNAPEKIKPFTGIWIRSKFTFHFSDLIVANSLAGLKSFKAPVEKSLYIHNGFDFKRTNNLKDKNIIKQQLDINTEHVVGMVASFSIRKDYNSYILAAQRIVKMRDDVTFIAVGDGTDLEKCKELVENEYKPKIKFIGWQSEIDSIINVFDIGVLATYTEGISNSIMEYMALGKPVVATDCSGTREIVIDGDTGFLVQRESVDDLSSKILKLLDSANQAKIMGERGKQRITELFSLEAMGSKFIAMYRNINLN